jgi:hypothetical protein
MVPASEEHSSCNETTKIVYPVRDSKQVILENVTEVSQGEFGTA